MNNKKSYLDYKFLGIHSFLETLEKSGTEYTLFDEDYTGLAPEILNSDDTVKTGFLSRSGDIAFFAEFGIKITKSYSSFTVFIFDHHPLRAELEEISCQLEAIINANLDNVDISEIASAMSAEKRHLNS